MFVRLSSTITSCIRCGTCCLKGGPVLHHEDKKVLLAGHAGHQHLVTIRKGERAYNPLTDRVEEVTREIVKVRDRDGERTCFFYDEKNNSCGMYENRFLECRLLKCWDPADIIAVIGKNTITRKDIINPRDPVVELIETHEVACPLHRINELIVNRTPGMIRSETCSELAGFVQNDNEIRSYAISELGMKPEYELFIFGRPLTAILESHGLTVRMQDKNELQGKTTY